MEKSTTLGMTLGLFAVGYGMYLKGADPHALINPAAFLIIFAGTFAALLNAFPMKDIKRFGKLLKIIFTGKKLPPNRKSSNFSFLSPNRPNRKALWALRKKPTRLKILSSVRR